MAEKSINDVPMEILQSILAYFRNSGTLTEFVPCLRVCQKWKDVGTPLAWRTLVLDRKKMERLVLSALQYNHPFKRVSSLTISLGGPYPSECQCFDDDDEGYGWVGGGNHQVRCDRHYSEMEGVEKAVERVLVLVRHKMVKLKTFSLFIDPEPGEEDALFCGCHDSIFSERFGPSIIRSLPTSCINLEIDTGRAHIGCCCTLLRELLPRLVHLRVRIQSLCWKLLSAHEPAVEHDLDKQRTGTQVLSSTLRSVMISSVLYPRSKAGIGFDLWSTRWVKNCQNQKGPSAEDSYPQLPSYFASVDIFKALPNIERFEMLTSMEKDSLHTMESLCHQGEIDYFVKYDVLSNRSHLLPFTFLAVLEGPMQSGADWISLRKNGWNMMRDENDQVLIGNVADMESHIENDFWLTSIEGARFPGEMSGFAAQGTPDTGIIWRETLLKRQDAFEEQITARGGTVEKPKSIPEINHKDQEGYRPFPYAAALKRHTFSADGFFTRIPVTQTMSM